ncbi:MAG TPA: neutral/alkaline non-lysosomal ceramidase N-terminal domain-containing protein [Verrucomicrobiota bacterium]|nr:neutral/alkaline non-lysosomal ceramidase N-terminal domain-containing protein [Verrucomicrobiota bacterium]
MMKHRVSKGRVRRWLASGLVLAMTSGLAAEPPGFEVGLAVREITPEVPIRLAGYAGRNRPADKVDHPLVVQAMALRNPGGDRFVFVALDNCEVSRAFMEPVVQEMARRHEVPPGAVAVVSSHTHSAPVIEATLIDMAQPSADERQRIQQYSRRLRDTLVEVVGAALADLQPAALEYGLGRATFAMNRRVYQGDHVVFGDNPDGPVDWDVPVLRVKGADGATRAIVFGYACHGTSVRGDDDWYVVSGEYMGYARQHLEELHPGTMAIYLTGMGADSDPSPRGRLVHAKRHGIELAGAILTVLNGPMRPVRGAMKRAYAEVELPLVDPPGRDRLEADAQSADVHIRQRAQAYLKRLDAGEPLPRAVPLPVSILRFGDDLTFIVMGGEVVVDYARRFKRLLANDNPWPVGYAYEVPCYIPTARLIKEGGYESDSSMIYYGFYGPFQTSVEDKLVTGVTALVTDLRTP